MGRKIDITQVAYSTPFDNDTNGFLAEDVQAAIEEVDSRVTGKPRAIVTMGYQGTANSGRWLETFDSIASNDVPFITAESATIQAIALVNKNSNTGTITIYKNGVSVTTISLTAQTYNTVSGLTIALATGDSLSAQLTSGTLTAPMLYTSIQINL